MLNGKVNLGLNGLTSANIWYPTLNAWKMGDEIQIISNIGPANKFTSIPPNTANSAWLDAVTGQAYVDADGELANPLPADATDMIRIFESHSTNILTIYTGRYGESWVLKFDGTASSVSSGLTGAVRIGNRITGTWPANQSNKQVIFSGIDHNDPPRNIRLCPLAWESLLDGGALFNPDWLAEVARGSGIVRFMDWQVTNSNRSTRTFANIPTESFYKWGGGNGSSVSTSTYLQGGMPLSVLTSIAEQAESHAWVNIPHVLGTAKTSRLAPSITVTITIASPGVITWRNHPLPADWPVQFTTTGALPTGFVVGTTYYVVGASITTDTFQLSATPGGSAINTSGSQSGTHTGWGLGLTQANPPVALSQNHPFVNGDQVIPYGFGGMIQASTVTITIASPGVITWTSHPLQTDNGVRFSTTSAPGDKLPNGLTAGQTYYVVGASITANAFQVSATPGGVAINTSGTQQGTHTGTTEIVRNTFTVANATTHTFELTGVNTTGFSKPSLEPGWLTSLYSLSGMTAQMTLFAEHFRDNMPSALLTYFEFSNEAWNSIFDAFHWLAAQARAKFANDNSYKMTGYLLAHCMKTVSDVYGDRSKWKGVLATFTVSTTVTTDIISGINTYISEQAPGLTINDLVDDVAIVGYWGGNLEEPHAAISQAWLDDSITRFEADLEPTRYAYYNRKINADLYDGNETGITFSVVGLSNNFWPGHKTIADANGLGYIQYEAGNSNALADGGLSGNAEWREFFPEGTQTNEDAVNYTAMFAAWAAIGGTYPSKFTEANPVNIFGSFGALRYPGDSNPVWDAVVAFNGGEESGSEVVQEPVIHDGVGGTVKRKRKKKPLPGIQPAFPVHLYRSLLPEVPEEEPEIQEPPPKQAVEFRPLPPLSSLGESLAVPADIQIRLLRDAERIRDDEDALTAILSAL